jgi:hypothetical protein
MKSLVRRDFLKVGAVGLAGIAVSNPSLRPSSSVPKSKGSSIQCEFLIEPGLTSRLNPVTHEVLNVMPWAIPSMYEHLIPALQLPVSFTPEKLRRWFDADGSALGSQVDSQDPFDAMMQVPINGTPDVSDILLDSALSLKNSNTLDLEMDFKFAPEGDHFSDIHFSTKGGLPVVEILKSPGQQRGDITPNFFGQTPTLFGFKIVAHGPEVATFGSCVPRPVNHYNVVVQRARAGNPGRFDNILNFHLGAYRDDFRRLCFALWQSKPLWEICLKICNPNISDLTRSLSVAISEAASRVNIQLKPWEISLLAGIAAGILFLPLLALA